MAQDTRRDRVWRAVMEAAATGVEQDLPESGFDDHIPDGFTKSDITDRVEASGRTVHDVLQTMAEYGYLKCASQRIYVPTSDGYEIQETMVYVPEPDGPFPVGDDFDPEAFASEDNDSETGDSRYKIACPECDYTTDRQQNSQVVKDVRRRERACPLCGTRLRLEKDNRPDPPECPECDEDVLFVEEGDDDGPELYVHTADVLDVGGMAAPELNGCWG